MKHSKEYYKRRQQILNQRYDKISVDIENLIIELHNKQEQLNFLVAVQIMLENKMQALDTQSEIDAFLDSILPKGWYK